MTKGPFKLDAGHKHILKLIDKGQDKNGWTKVSEALMPHMLNNMPQELIEIMEAKVGGHVRLTEKGKQILEAMQWL